MQSTAKSNALSLYLKLSRKTNPGSFAPGLCHPRKAHDADSRSLTPKMTLLARQIFPSLFHDNPAIRRRNLEAVRQIVNCGPLQQRNSEVQHATSRDYLESSMTITLLRVPGRSVR
jgi:hypothetical protein